MVALIFDITSRKSFQEIKDRWVQEITKTRNTYTQYVLIGNKIDNNKNRQVTFEEGVKLANKVEAIYIEVTCKENAVLKLFPLLINNYKDYYMRNHKK
mmetsp:Transcript_4029/g.3368  ORF Transcript_4029/g.3368 Transcript_4029/m.3368 type:complete len:98 (-) Transcript_4029:20-313(-)